MLYRKLIALSIALLLPISLRAQTPDYESGDSDYEMVLERGEAAPFRGVLVPPDYYAYKEKKVRKLEYIEPEYINCRMNQDDSFWSFKTGLTLVAGLLIGGALVSAQR